MMISKRLLLVSVFFLLIAVASETQAAPPQSSSQGSSGGAVKVDLGQAQQKYLSNNASSEVQVVQNRKYTKAKKFEIGITGGLVSADPFLNDSSVGGFVGYHFSEYFGLRTFYWKDITSKSSSWYDAGSQSNLFVNTNAAQSMTGVEFKFIPIYGKVSVYGSRILYYDMNLFAGGGIRSTQSGTVFSPIVGVGEQFFLGKSFAVGLDYRMMYYKENVIDQQTASATYGKVAGSRTSFSHNVLFSLSWLLGI